MQNIGIGDVSQVTGINASTLRLWEQHGLISPERSASGHRIYRDSDISAIRAIHRLRKVDGLNMSAIKQTLAASAPQPSHPTSPLSEQQEKTRQLGVRFRITRQKQNLSLDQASKLSGLPISFISTFERTGQGATVTSLQRLAASYNTSVTKLTAPEGHGEKAASCVVRNNEARVAPYFTSGITVNQLPENLESLDCQKWILQPGAGSDGAYSHEGEEFIHILQGVLTITIDGGEQIRLGEGDSISFNSQSPHAWRAVGDIPTMLLWINTPKSF